LIFVRKVGFGLVSGVGVLKKLIFVYQVAFGLFGGVGTLEKLIFVRQVAFGLFGGVGTLEKLIFVFDGRFVAVHSVAGVGGVAIGGIGSEVQFGGIGAAGKAQAGGKQQHGRQSGAVTQ